MLGEWDVLPARPTCDRGRSERMLSKLAAASVASFLAVVLSTAAAATRVAAAAPDNDVQSGAVVVSGVPFSHTQDTSEATVDAGEDIARDFCLGAGAPAFEHAVWFTAVLPGGEAPSLMLDVTQSSYGAGIAVLQDTPGGLVARACAPRTFVTSPGTQAGTYFLVMFGDGTTPSTGGELVVTIDTAPAPPELAVTVDPTGTATKDGAVRISGTLACQTSDGSGQAVVIQGQVTQTVGRLIITSLFSTEVFARCDGATDTWEAVAPPFNGRFAGGRAAVVAQAVACTPTQCATSFVEANVKLTRSRT